MNIIRVLPEKVASRIAAGEIIERPASVVRELLDNSIDAGSERITVKMGQGGRSLIKVSDDGAGMSRDDLLLCLERHATSKIHSESDLFSIGSLGFRGEALPSIASVSRMVIKTRRADQVAGHKLNVAGGKLKSIEETGTPAGTIVEVRDLFFNMPARRKFLRTARTETDHVVDIFSRIALPFTNIHFKLDDAPAQKTILNLPISENQRNRLSALVGRNVAVSMIHDCRETDDLKLNAYLGPPDLNRARGDRLFLYVNGRNVRDRLLTRAIMEAYGQRLMKGRYPYAVVLMEIDPSLVDVNVHPTKQEIRFQNSHQVYQALLSTAEKALGRRLHTIPGGTHAREEEPIEEQGNAMLMAEPERQYSEKAQTQGRFRDKHSFREIPLTEEVPRVIGQLKGTYVLCQTKEGLLMVDQHAAHERIVYENLKNAYRSAQIERQGFLIPHKLEFSSKEGGIVLRRLDQLAELGLEMEHFGGNTFLLRSVPAMLVNAQWENVLFDLIPVLEEEAGLTTEVPADRLLTVMACHGAIRAGKRMSREEMDLLLKQLEETGLPTHCPHGRPISRSFTFAEIEKLFKRVV